MPEATEIKTWADAAVELFDLLTGRKAEVTYEFENLEIFVPLDTGTTPTYATWKLNGILKVRAREETQQG